MKFVRVKKSSVNEGYIRSIDSMKADLDKKRTADDIRKYSANTLLESKKKMIGKLMIHWFVSPTWHANSVLSSQCNLRPGTTEIGDFNIFLKDITSKSEEEQLKYLHERIDYSVYFEDRNYSSIVVEVPLKCSAYPVNTIIFTGNALFNYLDRAEKSFEQYIKFPIKLKIRILKSDSKFAPHEEIAAIAVHQNVKFKKLIDFFKNRVVNPEFSEQSKIGGFSLRILNRDKEENLSELYELGDYMKFDTVVLRFTASYLQKSLHLSSTSKNYQNAIFTNLNTLSGIENLLKNVSSEIHLSKVYLNASEELADEVAENFKTKKNIVLITP